MSITDELRKWGRATLADTSLMVRMEAIADRIDAEHDKALNSVDDAYDSGYNVGYDEGFASADDWLAQHEDAMAEHGWIRLPKDADGEYIRIGDEVETTNFGTVEVEGFVHRAVAFYNYSEQPAYLCTTPANLCRHHHAPTVDDVLTEFAAKLIERGELTNGAAQTIAEYAAKLRLAGSDAE